MIDSISPYEATTTVGRSVRDKFSQLVTTEVRSFISHDIKSVVGLGLGHVELLGLLEDDRINDFLLSPLPNKQFKEVIAANYKNGKLDAGGYAEQIRQISRDEIMEGRHTLADNIIDVVLKADNTGHFITDEQALEERKKAVFSRQLLSVFADSAHFFQNPTKEGLLKLKGHRVNLQALSQFFRGDITYTGEEDVEIDGVEAIMLANLVGNAVEHGLTHLHPRVILEVESDAEGNTVRVVNYSKEPLTDDNLQPGISRKIDENGNPQPGSGYGLAIVKTLADEAGFNFGFSSERVTSEDVYRVTTTISNRPRPEIKRSAA